MTYSTVKLSLNINATNYLGSAVVECFMAMLVDRKTLWGNVEVTGFEPRRRRTYNGHSERLTHSNCRVGLGTCDRSRHPGPPPWLADPSRPYSCCRSCADSLRPFLWHALRGSPSWMNLQSLLFTWAKKMTRFEQILVVTEKKSSARNFGRSVRFPKTRLLYFIAARKKPKPAKFCPNRDSRSSKKNLFRASPTDFVRFFDFSVVNDFFFSQKFFFSLSPCRRKRLFSLSLKK